MKENYSSIVLVLFLLIIGFGISYFFISHMPPIKVQIVGQVLK